MSSRMTARRAAVEMDDDEAITFDAGSALEQLRGEVEGIEALAHAVTIAITELPPRSIGPAERRAVGRLFWLIRILADAIESTLDTGDELVAQLGDQLSRKAKRR